MMGNGSDSPAHIQSWKSTNSGLTRLTIGKFLTELTDQSSHWSVIIANHFSYLLFFLYISTLYGFDVVQDNYVHICNGFNGFNGFNGSMII